LLHLVANTLKHKVCVEIDPAGVPG
jgi:hypothetical protein